MRPPLPTQRPLRARATSRRPGSRFAVVIRATLFAAFVAFVAFIAFAAGCRERPADSSPPPAAGAPSLRLPATHRSTRPLPEPHWTRGGTEHDTLFADPASAVADADRVYVLDRGAGRVLALRADDGRLAWSTLPAGSTTGSDSSAPASTTRATDQRAASPVAIAAATGGGVAVADLAHSAITVFDRDGHATRATPLGAIGDVRSLCALPDSGYLLRGSGLGGGLSRLSPLGAARPVPLPWPDLVRAASLTTQAWLASDTDGSPCAIALVLGRGFALYDGSRSAQPLPYVEPLPLPEVVTTVTHRDSGTTVTRQTLSSDRIAAQSIAAGGGLLAVAFDGGSPQRSRLVDLYDARSGRYLESALVPHRVRALATNGRDLFVLHTLRGRPALAAVPLPPRAIPVRPAR